MARFDAWPSPDGPGWLLEVQTDLLHDLNARVVVPLMPLAAAPRPAARLNPVILVAGEAHAMATQFMSAVPASILQGSPVSLKASADAVANALDLLLAGV